MASSSKHRARLLASSALISTYLFFADFAYAGAAIIPDAKSLPKGPKWAAQSFLDLKAGSQRNIGQIGLMGPVFQNDRSMLFADFRFMKDSRNNAEGNYGLGYRRIVGEWVYGGYGFFDHRETRFNNIFNQVTVGAEALSTTWEARANVYLPVSSKKLIRVEKPVPTGRDRFEGGTVLHEENLQMEKVDIPMGGLDLELGYQVLKGLRVYGAAYYFRASGAPTIRGGRIRVTYDINKYLALEGQAQRDNIRKNTYFAGVRLTVPLYDVDKAHKLTDVEKLMLRPVVRDIDIVEQAVDREVLVDKLIPTVPIEDVSIEEGAAHTNSSLVGVYNLQDPQIQRALLKKMPKVSAVFDVQEQKRVSARDIKKRIIGIRHDKAKSKRENESVQHLWKIWRWREDYAHRDDEATMSPERKLLLSQRELTSPSKSNSSARFGREPSIPPQNSSVRSRRDLHSEFERVKQDEQQKVHNSPISAADLVKKFEEFSSDNTRQINANSVVRESVTKTEVQETTLVVSVSPSVSTSSMSAELSSSQETKEHGGSQPLDGVVKVQSVARGYLSRKHQKQQSDLKKAVVLGHKLWRGKLAERAYQADRSDIVTVQSVTRGNLARKHQKQQLDLKKAVVLGQKLWRGRVAERAYQADRSDIVTVQSLTRGNLARKHQSELKEAVVLGQNLWREKVKARQTRADSSDVVTVQSLTRGYLIRKQQSELKKAVVLGQKLWRRKLAERAYKSDRSDIVKVQSLARGYLTRKDQKQQSDLKKAVVLGQNLWRGKLAERAYKADRSDIVTAQSFARGYLIRKQQSELKKAVILGQKLWREKVRARQIRADRSSIVTVQSLARGYLARKRQSELKKAVVLGQKLWRGKTAASKLKAETGAASTIQRVFRDYEGRKEAAKLKKAAITIQNQWRKKVRARQTRADRSSIVTAQSLVRGYLARKRQLELKKAAIAVQKQWREKVRARQTLADRSDKESPTIVPPANELVVYSGNLNHSTSLDDSLTDVEFVSAHEIHNNYENLVEPEMMIRLGHSADSEIDQKKFTERKNSFLISRDRALEGISSLLDEHKNGVVEITNPHELGLKDFQLKHKGIEILERSSSKGVTKWTVANVEPKEKNENFPPLVTNSDSSRQPTTVLGIQGNEEESLIEKVLIPSQNLHPRAGDFAHLFEESDTDGPVLTELSGSVELSVNEESTKDRSALSSSQNEEGVAKKERIKVASLHPRAGDFAHLFEESDTDGPVLTELSNSLDSSVNEESTKERSVPTSSQNEEEVAKKERIKVASLHQRADEFAHLFEESDTDEPVLTELSSSVEMPANEESTEDRSALSSSQNEEGVANKENTSSPQKYPLNNGEVVKPFDNKPQLHPDAKKYAGKFGTNSGLHPDAKKYANEFGTNPGLHPNANEYADQFVETPKKEGLFARIGRRIFGGKRS